MAVIDPNQIAEKLISQSATISGGYKASTVRLVDGKIALCTSTYNFSQSEETKNEIARRVAALWNLAAGIPTEELEALDASGFKLRK